MHKKEMWFTRWRASDLQIFRSEKNYDSWTFHKGTEYLSSQPSQEDPEVQIAYKTS